MAPRRRMKLGALINASGHHPAAWTDPATPLDADSDVEHFVRLARTAERGLLDLFFLADVPAMRTAPIEIVRRWPHYTNVLEPLTALSAIARETTRIGLGATVSTSFDQPYTVARQFASLDRISHGRAAWNVVTTAAANAPLNYGLEELPDPAARYARADEFVGLVQSFWRTWDDDAFVQRRETSEYFRPEGLHLVEHEGAHFSVHGGALNLGRSAQGEPAIMVAGASNPGRDLAGKRADVVFAVGKDVDAVKAFSDDVRARAVAHGREAADVTVLGGISVVVGETTEAAEAAYRTLRERLDPEVARFRIAQDLEADLDGLAWDEPIPRERIPEGSKLFSAFKAELTRQVEEGRTLREIALGYERGQGVWAGSPAAIADRMEEWHESGAVDGFIVTFQSMPAGLEGLVDGVVPELQRRGLFRTEYSAQTLRGHLRET